MEATLARFRMGYLSGVDGVPPMGLDGSTPHQGMDRCNPPLRQDWMGSPQKKEQQSEYLLCGERYASCIHARGLCCCHFFCTEWMIQTDRQTERQTRYCNWSIHDEEFLDGDVVFTESPEKCYCTCWQWQQSCYEDRNKRRESIVQCAAPPAISFTGRL